MPKKKEKIVRLKNKYNGTVVLCADYWDVVKSENIEFIRVYDPANPQRTYLANKAAFVIVTK